MTRVLQVVPSLNAGGAERLAAELACALDPARVEVGIASLYSSASGALHDLLRQQGVRTFSLEKRPGLDLRVVGRLREAIRDFRPDVVHTHQYVLRYVLPAILPAGRLPVLHTVHNLAEREVSRSGRMIHRAAFRMGVVPVAIAEEVRRSIGRVYGMRDVPLIPNGIPTGPFRRPALAPGEWRAGEGFAASDVLFACVARLMVQKNHALLLRAFARVHAQAPAARLLLVGEGELLPDLTALALELGISDRVHFLGLRRDVREILHAADAFVLSSDWEGNPLSVMEAMATGTAPVCTAVGGVPELIEHGRSGLLVEPGDEAALAEAMLSLARSPGARERMAAAAAEQALRAFDVGVMAERYSELYERSVRGARRAPRLAAAVI